MRFPHLEAQWISWVLCLPVAYEPETTLRHSHHQKMSSLQVSLSWCEPSLCPPRVAWCWQRPGYWTGSGRRESGNSNLYSNLLSVRLRKPQARVQWASIVMTDRYNSTCCQVWEGNHEMGGELDSSHSGMRGQLSSDNLKGSEMVGIVQIRSCVPSSLVCLTCSISTIVFSFLIY